MLSSTTGAQPTRTAISISIRPKRISYAKTGLGQKHKEETLKE
jgi:hypothetical protein